MIVLTPIQLDCQNIRKERQTYNNRIVFDSIKNKDEKRLKKVCNTNELQRVLEESEITLEKLLEEASKNDLMNKILSGRISKNATRQGSLDEHIQINTCSEIAQKLDVKIKILPNDKIRPTKEGKIITKKEMKKKEITKDMCLKSFDAKIDGKMKGYLFAKIVYGSGGHQDNVFEEADQLCEWVVSNDRKEVYVVLIDTDQKDKFENLVNKYKDKKNILVVNHYQFQNYLITKFN